MEFKICHSVEAVMRANKEPSALEVVPARVVGQQGGEWGTKAGCEARGSKDRMQPLSTNWDLHLSLPTSHFNDVGGPQGK